MRMCVCACVCKFRFRCISKCVQQRNTHAYDIGSQTMDHGPRTSDGGHRTTLSIIQLQLLSLSPFQFFSLSASQSLSLSVSQLFSLSVQPCAPSRWADGYTDSSALAVNDDGEGTVESHSLKSPAAVPWQRFSIQVGHHHW